jgi:hypothetical protein
MKISYDKATDSLYIHLADRALVDSAEVKVASFSTLTPMAPLVGMDVQDASEGRT